MENWIDDSLKRVISIVANSVNYDEFNHYYATNVLLNNGTTTHENICRILGLRKSADIKQVYDKLKEQTL